MVDIALQVKNVTKMIRGKEIIQKSNMSVASDTVYAFLGPNGAGKTTMFKMIAGLMMPTNGKVEVFGSDIATHRSTIVKDIGSIIEVPYFYEHLTAKRNLEIHMLYMDVAIEKEHIERTLEMVGLEVKNNQPVSEYSLGMRQRLGIARALVHNPKLLVLDEPINGLDPEGIRDMRKLFARITKQENKTIIFSSHILTEAELLADKIGIISKGCVLKEQTMDEIHLRYPGGVEEYYFDNMEGVGISV